MGVGVGAGLLAGGGLSGIFSTLSEIVDEVGDTFQSIIEATSHTFIIDRDVEHREIIYVRSGKNKGRVKETKVTTDHWKVSLFEVLLAGLILGVWEFVKSADKDGNPKLGLAMKTGPLGVAGMAGAAVDPQNPFWWVTPWGTASEVIHQLTDWPMKKGQ